jgi:hypothetical protein
MTDQSRKQSHDSALGMDNDISRRGFMNATLPASGGESLKHPKASLQKRRRAERP